MFPYRWLPRTIIPNILYFFRSIKDGIKNIVRWTPIIWDDFDWDWEPLAKIMEYKLRRMSKMQQHGVSMNSDKYAKQTLICAELLKRLREDDMGGVSAHQHMARTNEWQKMLGKILGKNLRCWWD